MVAYSFHRTFADRVERRLKLSTIRGHRRRHARPGEPVQLFTGMRTRACRKLVDPDPICVGVDEMWFDLSGLADVERPPTTNAGFVPLCRDVRIMLNGMPIEGEERHAFAASDGFVDRAAFPDGEPILPFHDMVLFWMAMHGPRLFEGVRIRWEHQA